jgi:hypothetical protein
LWGLYYGVLIAIYQLVGVRGDLRASPPAQRLLAWAVMFSLISFGWLIFRAPSLGWLRGVLLEAPFNRTPQELTASLILLTMLAFYALPLVLKWRLDQWKQQPIVLQAGYYALATAAAVVFFNSSSPDFIYLQF